MPVRRSVAIDDCGRRIARLLAVEGSHRTCEPPGRHHRIADTRDPLLEVPGETPDEAVGGVGGRSQVVPAFGAVRRTPPVLDARARADAVRPWSTGAVVGLDRDHTGLGPG